MQESKFIVLRAAIIDVCLFLESHPEILSYLSAKLMILSAIVPVRRRRKD